MKKYNIPLTYEPKIPKVLSGDCNHTIRIGTKYYVGDLVSFYGWSGIPYDSPWLFGSPPKYWPLIQVDNIKLFPTGIKTGIDIDIQTWDLPLLDIIAEADGIDPPTGEKLGRVLNQYHKIPPEGTPAQIIRWRWME